MNGVKRVISWLLGGLFLLTIALGWWLTPVALKCKRGGFDQIEACGNQIVSKAEGLKLLGGLASSKQVDESVKMLELLEYFWPLRSKLLGKNEVANYLILLQNDNELRANGGFFGSYAVVSVDKASAEFSFEDIYVPDGQLEGHVEPPKPIQQAFKSGQWRLRDSDWSADFTVAAKQIRWFFEKGGEERVDQIVTLPLSVVRQVLAITGAVDIADYDMQVTKDNIFLWLQNESEVGFFPGSTQKKNAIDAAGKAVWQKIQGLAWDKKLKIGQLILDHLNKGNILINSGDDFLQAKLERKDWAGKLKDKTQVPKVGRIEDAYLLVESNLGANKANCCVRRQTGHRVVTDGGQVRHEVKVSFDNEAVKNNPEPPFFYGGNYLAYLRFYIPKTAEVVEIKAAPSVVERKEGYPPLLSLDEEKNFNQSG